MVICKAKENQTWYILASEIWVDLIKQHAPVHFNHIQRSPLLTHLTLTHLTLTLTLTLLTHLTLTYLTHVCGGGRFV